MSRTILFVVVALLTLTNSTSAQTREEKVRNDKKKFENHPLWIYNDLPRGIAEAKKTGKPILVVMRCLPCEECVKLDDDVVNEIRACARCWRSSSASAFVSTMASICRCSSSITNQSFAAFLLNADGTVYGRYGTPSASHLLVG